MRTAWRWAVIVHDFTAYALIQNNPAIALWVFVALLVLALLS